MTIVNLVGGEVFRKCLICGNEFCGTGNYCIHCITDKKNNMPSVPDSKKEEKEYLKKGD